MHFFHCQEIKQCTSKLTAFLGHEKTTRQPEIPGSMQNSGVKSRSFKLRLLKECGVNNRHCKSREEQLHLTPRLSKNSRIGCATTTRQLTLTSNSPECHGSRKCGNTSRPTTLEMKFPISPSMLAVKTSPKNGSALGG